MVSVGYEYSSISTISTVMLNCLFNHAALLWRFNYVSMPSIQFWFYYSHFKKWTREPLVADIMHRSQILNCCLLSDIFAWAKCNSYPYQAQTCLSKLRNCIDKTWIARINTHIWWRIIVLEMAQCKVYSDMPSVLTEESDDLLRTVLIQVSQSPKKSLIRCKCNPKYVKK